MPVRHPSFYSETRSPADVETVASSTATPDGAPEVPLTTARSPLSPRTLALQLGSTSLNQLAGRGTSALLATLIARSLGAAGQGRLTLATALVDVGCVLGALGLPQASSHLVASQRSRLSPLFGNSLLLSGAIAAIGVTAAIISYYRGSGELATSLVACALVAIPVTTVSQLLAGLTWGLSDIRAANLIQLGRNVLPLIPVALAVRFGLLTPAIAMLATTSGLVFSAIASAWIVLAKHGARPRVSYPLLTESLGYGMRWCANSFLLMLLDKSLFFIIAATRGGIDVAYVWVAMGASDALQILPAAAASVLLPHLSRMESLGERWHAANRLGLWMTVAMVFEAVVLLVLMKRVVATLFGAEYLPAVPGCLVLTVAYVSEGIGRAQYLFLAASRRHALALYGSLIGGGLALAVAWPLMLRFGALGATVGVATGQIVTVVTNYFCARSVLRDASVRPAEAP